MTWTFETNINWNTKYPIRTNYICSQCQCTITQMCHNNWRTYQKDVMNHLHLKYKDTRKSNGS